MPESSSAVPTDDTPPAAPVFRARLTPHRSLSRSGFVIVMAVLGVSSFVAGMVFLILGAWPVLGFFGLDVALVYVAFTINYRDGRAFELVELDHDRLTLTRVSARGQTEIETFNPYWVRVLSTEGSDGRNDLRFAVHGRETRFAVFLSNEERLDLKVAIETALHMQRTSFG